MSAVEIVRSEIIFFINKTKSFYTDINENGMASKLKHKIIL